MVTGRQWDSLNLKSIYNLFRAFRVCKIYPSHFSFLQPLQDGYPERLTGRTTTRTSWRRSPCSRSKCSLLCTRLSKFFGAGLTLLSKMPLPSSWCCIWGMWASKMSPKAEKQFFLSNKVPGWVDARLEAVIIQYQDQYRKYKLTCVSLRAKGHGLW